MTDHAAKTIRVFRAAIGRRLRERGVSEECMEAEIDRLLPKPRRSPIRAITVIEGGKNETES